MSYTGHSCYNNLASNNDNRSIYNNFTPDNVRTSSDYFNNTGNDVGTSSNNNFSSCGNKQFYRHKCPIYNYVGTGSDYFNFSCDNIDSSYKYIGTGTDYFNCT